MTSSVSIVEVVPAEPADSARTPWWLWPNLLSLDAPIISSLWQNLAARDAGISLSLATRIALPMAVWVIYLADRLLDNLGPENIRSDVPGHIARHRFYRHHRISGIALLTLVSLVLFATLPFVPAAVFHNGLLVGSSVAAYMLIVHVIPNPVRPHLPKELAVALIFSAGTTLGVWTRMPNPFAIVFPALLFALLCWLNCSATEIWERRRSTRANEYGPRSANWLVNRLTPLSLIACALSVAAIPFVPCHLLLAALALCSLAFCWLNGVQSSMKPDALRVLVDMPLVVPLLLLRLR